MQTLIITLIAGYALTAQTLASAEGGKKGESADFIVNWAPAKSLKHYTITTSGEISQGRRIYEVACVTRHILCTTQRILLNDDLLEVGSVGPDGKPEITASYGETRLFPLAEGAEYTETGQFEEQVEVTHYFLVQGADPDGTIPVQIETRSLNGEVLRKETRHFDPQRPMYWTKIEVLLLK